MANQKNVSGLGIFSILALYLVSMAVTIVTPAMATFGAHYGEQGITNISWISTLPTLFVVLGTFIAGAIMGKKIPYRTLAICASIVALLGGIAPAFFDNFALMLVCRAIFGFGCGLMAPLGNALILGLFEGQKQASLLGYGTLCMNGGGIAMQMLGGALAGKGWQMTFWGHAFMIIGLIFAFFLPEPEAAPVQAAAADTKKESMSKSVYVIAALIFLYNLFAFPVMMNVSTLFVNKGFAADAMQAATMSAPSLSLYTVAGVVAGLLFGTIFKFAKKFIMVIGFGLCGLGFLAVYVSPSAIVLTIGLMIVGFGFSCFFPAMMAWAGMVTPPTTIAAASSLILACMNLGGFVSSFWLSFLTKVAGENVYSGMIVAIVFALGTAVVFLFANPFKEK